MIYLSHMASNWHREYHLQQLVRDVFYNIGNLDWAGIPVGDSTDATKKLCGAPNHINNAIRHKREHSSKLAANHQHGPN